jgi:hypothetical protein
MDTGQRGKIVFFVLVGWIFQFVLAQKDASIFFNINIRQSFTFKTWLWIDGGTTFLGGILFGVFYNLHSCYWKTMKSYKPSFQLFILFPWIIFKVSWIWFEIGVFLNLINFKDCTKIIKIIEKCSRIDEKERLMYRMKERDNTFKKIHSLYTQA